MIGYGLRNLSVSRAGEKGAGGYIGPLSCTSERLEVSLVPTTNTTAFIPYSVAGLYISKERRMNWV